MQRLYTLDINAPIQKTFSSISEEANKEKWMYGQSEVEFKAPYDIKNPIGLKFHQKFAGLVEIDAEVVSFKPPEEFGFNLTVLGVAGNLVYRLTAIDENNTKLNLTVELDDETKSSKLIVAASMPVFERVIQSYLDSIKHLAEQPDAKPAAPADQATPLPPAGETKQ